MSLLSQPELSRWEGIIHGLRVNELQSVLGHFKSNKLGKKQDLVQRCVSILRTPLYQQEVTRYIQTNMHNNRPPVRQAPYVVPNMSVGQGNRDRANFRAGGHNRYPQGGGGWNGGGYGNGGATLAMHPVIEPVHHLRPIPLPFYDVVQTILPPVKLTAVESGMRMHRKEVLTFAIPAECVADLKYREHSKPLPRREVQLRFFLLDTNYQLTEQMDDFPHQAIVRIDDNAVTLPACIPTNKVNVEPKRPSRPVDITQNCQPLRDGSRSHKMIVEWTGDRRAWAVAIYIVTHLTAEILKDRMLSNPNFKQPLETTKQTIMRRLGGGFDEDITMDQLKISLLCPLGRTRMTVPARGRDCTHLQCFDLDLYLKMNEKRPTWKCAVCSCSAPYSKLIVDGYFHKMLADVGSDTSEVELLKDGSYQTIREEVNELSDSDDEPKPRLVAGDGSGDQAKAAAKKSAVPDDDIIILDSDDEDDQLRQAIRESMTESGAGCSPKHKRGQEIDVICLDDSPPRNTQNNQQEVLPVPSIPIPSLPSTSSSTSSVAATSASSSSHSINGNQQPRGISYQQMLHELNNQGYNFHANWGIPVNQQQQQTNHFQRPPGGFIGGNMAQGGYMAPPYFTNQMGQPNYRHNGAPQPTPPPPSQNLAHLLQNLSASYQPPSYNPQ